MATDADAARARVLAARSELGGELQYLEASVRERIDIPSKIKRSPAKAAAVAGGVAFLAVRGPGRVFRLGRRLVRGKDAPLPSRMLPDEIDKSLRRLGSDGDKVRGVLERDFAAYVKHAQSDRQRLRNVLVLSVFSPLLQRGTKAVTDYLFTPNAGSFGERLEAIRQRTGMPGAGADRAAAATDGAGNGSADASAAATVPQDLRGEDPGAVGI